MTELQRLTTEYIEAEDRMRICGELASGETLVMWLSQRLLLRLLPHVFLWLEKQGGDSLPVEIAQSFAQDAARAELTPEAPVLREEHSQEWLAEAVDLSFSQDALLLQFRAKPSHAVTLNLASQPLRQWLNILHSLWSLAEWPTAVWPHWMESSQTHTGSTKTAVH